MKRRIRHHSAIVAAVVGFALVCVQAHAHSPHHVVAGVASAPVDDGTRHTYILITDQVFRSSDGGASWKNLVHGLNNQHTFTAVATSPAYGRDGTVFAASSGDGVYRSTDFGASWKKIDSGLTRRDIHRLSLSPRFAADDRLLAAAHSGGVWRTIDEGATWQMVLTEQVAVRSLAESAGGNDRPVVYAGDADGRIWRSIDNGGLWEIRATIPKAGAVTAMHATGTRVFAGTERGGLYRSDDSGASFRRVLAGAPEGAHRCLEHGDDPAGNDLLHVTSIAASSGSAGERIYLTSRRGAVYFSEGGGAAWSVWQDGLSCDRQADQLGLPHFNEIEVLTTPDGRHEWLLAAFDGLFRSERFGFEWQQLETLPLGLIKGMAVTASERQPLTVALSTYGGGFYLHRFDTADWTIGNRGLATTRLTGLEFSPRFDDNGTIFAGARNRLLKSVDRGQSWKRVELYRPNFGERVLNKLGSWGLPTGWLRSPDARLRARIYPTDIEALPTDGERRLLIASRYHGLLTYSEKDEAVEHLWPETERIMSSLVVSPEFTADRTLYASIRSRGAFRSEDGGRSWSPVNDGLEFVAAWQEDHGRGDFRSDVIIAASPHFGADGTLFAGSPNGDGLFVSRDRGASWSRVDTDFGVSPAPVLAIAVSPEFETDGTIMVSVKGAGLFRSTDRGNEFQQPESGLIRRNASIEWLSYSPRYASDASLIAASDEALFLSRDGGRHWREIARPVRYEDMRDVVVLEGDWTEVNGERFSALTETWSAEPGSLARVRFVGGGIRWIGSTGPEHGASQVYVDGEFLGSVSQRSAERRAMQEIISIDGLDAGPHTLEIRVPAPAPGIETGRVAIDAIDVLPGTAARD